MPSVKSAFREIGKNIQAQALEFRRRYTNNIAFHAKYDEFDSVVRKRVRNSNIYNSRASRFVRVRKSEKGKNAALYIQAPASRTRSSFLSRTLIMHNDGTPKKRVRRLNFRARAAPAEKRDVRARKYNTSPIEYRVRPSFTQGLQFVRNKLESVRISRRTKKKEMFAAFTRGGENLDDSAKTIYRAPEENSHKTPVIAIESRPYAAYSRKELLKQSTTSIHQSKLREISRETQERVLAKFARQKPPKIKFPFNI